jgi:hypothetical protein
MKRQIARPHIGVAPDELVPDPQIFKEFGITSMTGWRWDHDPKMAELGWPAPTYTNPHIE